MDHARDERINRRRLAMLESDVNSIRTRDGAGMKVRPVNFNSDNVASASPEILAALVAANHGAVASYGDDPITSRLEVRFRDLFERDVAVFPVGTGTAANALCLAACVPPWGVTYCHRAAHIACDECGAPEFYSGGGKLALLDGMHARLAPEILAEALASGGAGVVHHAQPAAVSISQATEWGAVYHPDAIAEIAQIAHTNGCKLHVDGARFANALVTLGCSAADVTWRAGVDVLSFGATKNGALAAEAVVVFDTALAATIGYRRKRAGHLFSKMRFLSAQLDAYLADDLWLRNAGHANCMATRMAAGLAALGNRGFELVHPVEANELFVRLPATVRDGLIEDGFLFHGWGAPPAGPDDGVVRLVTAWNTEQADVDKLVARAAHHAETGAGAPQGSIWAHAGRYRLKSWKGRAPLSPRRPRPISRWCGRCSVPTRIGSASRSSSRISRASSPACPANTRRPRARCCWHATARRSPAWSRCGRSRPVCAR
jgi:threonine aldolase